MAKILQVCNSDFFLSKFIAPVVRALVDAGHEVDCVCEAPKIAPAVLGEKVRIIPLAFPREASVWKFARCISELRVIIRNGNYDCVSSRNRNASIAGRIAAWLEEVPVNLYTAHGFYFHDDQNWAMREATIRLESLLARITDFTLSQSREDVDLMTTRNFIPRDAIAVIGNGIDVERFRPRTDRRALESKLALAHNRFRVGAVGRIVRGKGFSDLLRAFGQLHAAQPESELLIVGGNIAQDISPYARELTEEARRMGLEKSIVLTGLTDVVEEYLSTCDVFVVPSYREGVPRALIEAMAAGLPAIATDIRGCREAVDDGKTGFLYPPHDVTRLASLLIEMHADPSQRAEFGRAARARAVAMFDERNYVKRQVDTINQLLATTPGARPAQPRSSETPRISATSL